MNEEKINYWKMKKDELIALCVEKQIPFDPDKPDRKAMIEQIVQADAEAGILAEAVAIDEDGEAGPVEVKREWVEIIFHNQDGFPKYVFLGLNGKFLYLPRECLCRIPAEFLEVAKHAVSKKIVQYDVDGRQTYREVRVPRLSYEVLDRGVL